MARLAIHPGEHLAEELKALGMSAAELARQMRVPTNRVTGILNGQRALTGDTALRLGHFFGTSPEFWLNLQTCTSCGEPRRESARPSGVCPHSSGRSSGARPSTPPDAGGHPGRVKSGGKAGSSDAQNGSPRRCVSAA
jgi:addiction module HigA family antidote